MILESYSTEYVQSGYQVHGIIILSRLQRLEQLSPQVMDCIKPLTKQLFVSSIRKRSYCFKLLTSQRLPYALFMLRISENGNVWETLEYDLPPTDAINSVEVGGLTFDIPYTA